MTEHVTLSRKELDRLQMMTRIAEKRLTRTRAAELLGMSERQVRRLYVAYQARGAAGLASSKRGRPSHRQLPLATRERVLGLIREHYGDFGPTFACEKLDEAHGLPVSVETVRLNDRGRDLAAAQPSRSPQLPAPRASLLRRRTGADPR